MTLESFRIEGGTPLAGVVRVGGAKNAVLPILAAALLTDEPVEVRNVPDLADVATMVRILEELGAEVLHDRAERTIRVQARAIEPVAPWELVRKMRASFEVLGPLLGRFGRAEVSYPGGCVFGVRPVDVHLKGFEGLGAVVETEAGYVRATARGERLAGGDVFLGTPSGASVGATRNVLMGAVLATGTSRLLSAACEPEVVDLCRLLVSMGAKIDGIGSPILVIEGVERLRGTIHEVIPDRIEAGTYLAAGAITGGRVRVEGCVPDDLAAELDLFHKAGIAVERGPTWVEVQERDVQAERLRPTDVTTQPHPGFPTDMQAQWMALMCLADGVSLLTERIFPDRYMHMAELLRLGAKVRRQGSAAVVHGIPKLSGASVMASDLRASASLVLAGLVADGVTEVHRVYHIDRGYERIEERLRALGARIERVAGQ
ncbi:MAG: UDP-N-acetylglucosamine 1-carboxyvinyltransferase [Planctomycetota bacterium]